MLGCFVVVVVLIELVQCTVLFRDKIIVYIVRLRNLYIKKPLSKWTVWTFLVVLLGWLSIFCSVVCGLCVGCVWVVGGLCVGWSGPVAGGVHLYIYLPCVCANVSVL